MSDQFMTYLQNNQNLLDATSLKFSIQCINGGVTITNNTYITSQSSFISSYLSQVSINNSVVYDIVSDAIIFTMIESNMTIDDSMFTNLTTTQTGDVLSVSFDAITEINNLTYSASNMRLITVLSSTLSVANIEVFDISLSQHLISFINCLSISMQNVNIRNLNITNSDLLSFSGSVINQISSMTVYDISAIILHITSSNITNIDNLDIENATKCIHLEDSQLGLIQNSIFSTSGSSTSSGGAFVIEDSSSTMNNVTFMSNTAQMGGAVYVQCSSYDI